MFFAQNWCYRHDSHCLHKNFNKVCMKRGRIICNAVYLNSRTKSEWQQKLPPQVLRNVPAGTVFDPYEWNYLYYESSTDGNLNWSGFVGVHTWRLSDDSTNLWLFSIVLRLHFHFVAIRMCGRGSSARLWDEVWFSQNTITNLSLLKLRQQNGIVNTWPDDEVAKLVSREEL